jgi:mono/diheme cytochrome c family protein
MFRRWLLLTGIVALPAAVLLAALQPRGDAFAAPAARVTEPAAPAPETVGLYRQYCLTCHGANGKGTEMRPAMPTIPDFTNRAWQESVSDVQIIVSILEGRGALMPPLRDRLTEEQVRGLVPYVRAFAAAEQR